MPKVFVLHHEYEWCGRDEVKFIGVYELETDAEAAVARLRTQPGFRDWPEGFIVTEETLGVDHWQDGFVTLLPVLIPLKLHPNQFRVCHAAWRPGDLYELGPVDDADEALFREGDVVRVTERSIPDHGERALVAVELAYRLYSENKHGPALP